MRYAKLERGDCFFLPRGWHHVVFSVVGTPANFNLAINFWFNREATLKGAVVGAKEGEDAAQAKARAGGALKRIQTREGFTFTLDELHSALAEARAEGQACAAGEAGAVEAERAPMAERP